MVGGAAVMRKWREKDELVFSPLLKENGLIWASVMEVVGKVNILIYLFLFFKNFQIAI